MLPSLPFSETGLPPEFAERERWVAPPTKQKPPACITSFQQRPAFSCYWLCDFSPDNPPQSQPQITVISPPPSVGFHFPALTRNTWEMQAD